ncbi:NADH-quinone oxidoreductase subunit K [Mycobacterium intermedium]|nr:sodium:proton antiporter [Mycobacterium intermedium]MCV6967440.1 NADH-quinone oxidoreductase subunit K [Mycobacterium intermedium]
MLAFAATAAVLFGGGAYLLLQRDLVRMVVGVALVSQAAVVALIGASLTRGQAPISPEAGGPVSDPLPQALMLTALVIGLATLALLLALVHRAVVVFRTAQSDELAAQESRHEERLQRDRQRDTSEMT